MDRSDTVYLMDSEYFAELFIVNYGGEYVMPDVRRYLSEQRLVRIHNALIDDAKMQSVAAELAVCAALKTHGMQYSPPKYSYAENGKPIIDDDYLSIAHTKGVACCSFCNIPIGVDIELYRNIEPRIANRILCDAEKKEYSMSSDMNSYLMKTWTAKESYLKYTGEGLSAGMKDLHFNKSNGHITKLTTGEKCYIRQYNYDFMTGKVGKWINVSRSNVLISVCTPAAVQMRISIFENISNLLGFLNQCQYSK